MIDDAAKRQGDLIKRYIRAKWRRPAHADDVELIGRRLDPTVRGRIDAIGMDDQELLQVPDHAVVARLEELERESEQELAQALNGARVIGRKRRR